MSTPGQTKQTMGGLILLRNQLEVWADVRLPASHCMSCGWRFVHWWLLPNATLKMRQWKEYYKIVSVLIFLSRLFFSQVVFEAKINGITSDIALDDITLTPGCHLADPKSEFIDFFFFFSFVIYKKKPGKYFDMFYWWIGFLRK